MTVHTPDTASRQPGFGDSSGVREAALRSLHRPGRGYWLLLTGLSAVVLAGIVAWVVQLREGLGVAGYNDEAFWSIYIADVVTFIGVSYGGAVVSAILRLTGATWRAPLTRLAEGTAVVTVFIGGAFIIPHLGRPERIWELVTRPNLSSPIFWDFVAVSTYTVASVVFFALPLVPDAAIATATAPDLVGRRARLYRAMSRGWAGTPRQRRTLHGALGVVSILIIPLAVSVHSVLSWAFALVSRPWWHESIWAPYFVVAALYSGVALVILVVAAFRRAYHLEAYINERHFVRLGFILAAFAMTYLYLTFADILPGAYVGELGPSAVFHELLVGHFAVWFWLFVVGGGLIPLLIIALPWTRTTRGLVVAAAFVAPSMWLKRMLMVVDPSTYDRVTRTFGSYQFTWVAVLITLAGVAAVPLLLMLLFRVVPLLSIDEMEELAGGPEGTPSDETTEMAPSAEPARQTQHEAEAVKVRVHRVLPGHRAATALALAVLAAGLLGVVVVGAPARADTTPAPVMLRLTGHESGATVDLQATLTTGTGKPLGGATVQFGFITLEFGPKGRTVPLGAVTTDKTGRAQLAYKPTSTGRERFTVSFAGTADAAKASAATTIAVGTATSAYTPAPRKPLASTGQVTVAVLVGIVAAVWFTLAAQVIRVRRALRIPA